MGNCQLFTSCIYIEEINKMGFCRFHWSPWLLRWGITAPAALMAVTGTFVFNLRLISSHSPSSVVSFATPTLVPCTAPSHDSHHPGNALAHPTCTPKIHLKLKFCFSWSLACVLQVPKGLTLKLTADASFIKLLSINLCIFMQRLREDPDCQQFPTVPFLPFSLPSFRFIIHNFLLPHLFTAVLL